MRNSLVIFGAWYFADVVEKLDLMLGWEICGCIDPEPPRDINSLKQVPESVADPIHPCDHPESLDFFRQNN